MSFTFSRPQRLTCNEHPLATASSVFKVVRVSFPNTLRMRSFTAGIRVDPPTISTASISSFFNPLKPIYKCSLKVKYLPIKN